MNYAREVARLLRGAERISEYKLRHCLADLGISEYALRRRLQPFGTSFREIRAAEIKRRTVEAPRTMTVADIQRSMGYHSHGNSTVREWSALR